jgi:predicted kinase
MPRDLILLRGLPVSGKSTLADVLSESGKYPVHSIVRFFTGPSGNYTFDHSKNHVAYKACETNTENDMLEGVEKIFVDNTFTINWEIEPYFKLAAKYGYRVFVITVENHHNGKNIHFISDEQILKMAEKYKVKLL